MAVIDARPAGEEDQTVGEPGLQLPPRFKKFGTKAPDHGLAALARFEMLSEELTTNNPALADPAAGTTEVTSFELGLNYWYSKRFRATFNYVMNRFSGDSPAVAAVQKKLDGKIENEFLFRLAVAL